MRRRVIPKRPIITKHWFSGTLLQEKETCDRSGMSLRLRSTTSWYRMVVVWVCVFVDETSQGGSSETWFYKSFSSSLSVSSLLFSLFSSPFPSSWGRTKLYNIVYNLVVLNVLLGLYFRVFLFELFDNTYSVCDTGWQILIIYKTS